MARVIYRKSSPYSETPQKKWYLDFYRHRTITQSDNDKLVTLPIRYQHRPDLLSYDLYGTPDYWWVFISRNLDKIQDPIWDFVAGLQIYLPTKETVEKI